MPGIHLGVSIILLVCLIAIAGGSCPFERKDSYIPHAGEFNFYKAGGPDAELLWLRMILFPSFLFLFMC